jgi:siroheme synthase-like protein
MLDVTGRPCLVVGGGPVGLRKARGLSDCGALVTVVAPEVDPAIFELGVTVEQRPYRPGEASRYRLVVTATGVSEVDASVAADAEGAGVWVNSADDPAHCTFYLPSLHRDGPVTLCVSTAGASPALATWLRGRLAAQLGDGMGTLAGLLAGARARVAEQGRPTTAVDWRALLDGPLPGLVRRGDLDGARRLLRDAVRDATS